MLNIEEYIYINADFYQNYLLSVVQQRKLNAKKKCFEMVVATEHA